MLTVYKNDGTHQVIHPSPGFYHPEVIGMGRNKKVISVRDKAQSVASYLSCTENGTSQWAGHQLLQDDHVLVEVGFSVEKPVKLSRTSTKQEIKDAKQAFKQSLINKYQEDIANGFNPEYLWNYYSQKALLAGSNTQES